MQKKAVVLLSGGVDSTTVLAIVRSMGYKVYALSFDYGQRHACELAAAREVAKYCSVEEHLVMPVDLRKIGGSALTSDAMAVPTQRSSQEMVEKGIPVTYVPARNTIFLSFALAWAEVLGCRDIFIGVNAVDYSGYPDCREEFIEAFERMANLATKSGVEGRDRIKIHAPLLHMTKAQIIEKGILLGVDYGMTHSCYAPDEKGRPCGACDSCILRAKGFQEAGVVDPACQ